MNLAKVMPRIFRSKTRKQEQTMLLLRRLRELGLGADEIVEIGLRLGREVNILSHQKQDWRTEADIRETKRISRINFKNYMVG